MPHDHSHGHIHGHTHAHSHAHSHPHSHPHDHNHAGDAAAMHLHSHLPPEEQTEELRMLAAQFLDGFRTAADKVSYLRLAGIPFEIPGTAGEGAEPLKLVDVEIRDAWQVGTASPAFGGGGLNYMPFPAAMVRERTNMSLIYVSLTERQDVALETLLAKHVGQ